MVGILHTIVGYIWFNILILWCLVSVHGNSGVINCSDIDFVPNNISKANNEANQLEDKFICSKNFQVLGFSTTDPRKHIEFIEMPTKKLCDCFLISVGINNISERTKDLFCQQFTKLIVELCSDHHGIAESDLANFTNICISPICTSMNNSSVNAEICDSIAEKFDLASKRGNNNSTSIESYYDAIIIRVQEIGQLETPVAILKLFHRSGFDFNVSPYRAIGECKIKCYKINIDTAEATKQPKPISYYINNLTTDVSPRNKSANRSDKNVDCIHTTPSDHDYLHVVSIEFATAKQLINYLRANIEVFKQYCVTNLVEKEANLLRTWPENADTGDEINRKSLIYHRNRPSLKEAERSILYSFPNKQPKNVTMGTENSQLSKRVSIRSVGSGVCDERTEFYCLLDDSCITKQAICDFTEQCSDGSDERGCTEAQCDFENDLCNWIIWPIRPHIKDFSWRRLRANQEGEPPGLASVGANRQLWQAVRAKRTFSGHHFMMIESTFNAKPQGTTEVDQATITTQLSTTILARTSSDCSLEFRYYCRFIERCNFWLSKQDNIQQQSDSEMDEASIVQQMIWNPTHSSMMFADEPIESSANSDRLYWRHAKVHLGRLQYSRLTFVSSLTIVSAHPDVDTGNNVFFVALDDVKFINCHWPLIEKPQTNSLSPNSSHIGQFQCSNKHLIDWSKVCDFVDDCLNSDTIVTNSNENFKIHGTLDDSDDENSQLCSNVPGREDFENFKRDSSFWVIASDPEDNQAEVVNNLQGDRSLPRLDHTLGTQQGHYLSIRFDQSISWRKTATSNVRFRKVTIRSPWLESSANDSACFVKFFYNILSTNTNLNCFIMIEHIIEVKDKQHVVRSLDGLISKNRHSQIDYWTRANFKILNTFNSESARYCIRLTVGAYEYHNDKQPLRVTINIDDLTTHAGCRLYKGEINQIFHDEESGKSCEELGLFSCQNQARCYGEQDICDFTDGCGDLTDERSCPAKCDFESGDNLCGWSDMPNDGLNGTNNEKDSSSFVIVRALDNRFFGPDSDHSLGHFGHYVTLGSSTIAGEARFISSKYQRSSSGCHFRLWYNFHRLPMGLDVAVRSSSSKDRIELIWSNYKQVVGDEQQMDNAKNISSMEFFHNLNEKMSLLNQWLPATGKIGLQLSPFEVIISVRSLHFVNTKQLSIIDTIVGNVSLDDFEFYDCASSDSGKCKKYEFACSHDDICVKDLFRCDGKFDCGDGSDEYGCQNYMPNPINYANYADCDFNDEHLCNWLNVDGIQSLGNNRFKYLFNSRKWQHFHQVSPNKITGPQTMFDREFSRLALTKDSYLGLTCDGNNYDRAILRSPPFKAPSNQTNRCSLSLFTYLFGRSVGSLRIFAVDLDGKEYELIEMIGDQGSIWKQSAIDLPPINSDYYIFIEGRCDLGQESVLAIDMIHMLPDCSINSINETQCDHLKQFQCLTTRHCIPLRFVCDGFVDCSEDGSDEKDCSAKQFNNNKTARDILVVKQDDGDSMNSQQQKQHSYLSILSVLFGLLLITCGMSIAGFIVIPSIYEWLSLHYMMSSRDNSVDSCVIDCNNEDLLSSSSSVFNNQLYGKQQDDNNNNIIGDSMIMNELTHDN